MNTDLHNDQRILENARAASVGHSIESFLVDRQAEGLSRCTLKFYHQHLHPFHTYCNDNAVHLVQDVSPDLLRRYFLKLAETHNLGGVHGHYRILRALFRWLAREEIMPPDWRNPMLKVKPPKVNLEPLEPISLEDVRSLIDTCERVTFAGERDRAVLLFLLDTGARASETCVMDLRDLKPVTGNILIPQGKGRKPRTVNLGHRSRKALRAYLAKRRDHWRGSLERALELYLAIHSLLTAESKIGAVLHLSHR